MLYFIEDYYKVDLLLYVMAWTSCLDIERAQYELAMARQAQTGVNEQ